MKVNLTSGKGGKVVATVDTTITGEHEGVKFEAGSHTFDSVERAFAFASAYDAAAAALGKQKAEIGFKRTYRNEFQVIGPDGFPVMTLTQDKVHWLERNMPVISATFRAHMAQIAESYDKRPKALPKGDPKIAEGKITLEPASVAAPSA